MTLVRIGCAEQASQELLHPDGQCGQTSTQIVADRLPVPWVGEEAAQRGMNADPLIVLREHVPHPVQCLNNAHRRPASPIEAARRGELEADLLVA